MREDKLRKKYPNTKSEEEFQRVVRDHKRFLFIKIAGAVLMLLSVAAYLFGTKADGGTAVIVVAIVGMIGTTLGMSVAINTLVDREMLARAKKTIVDTREEIDEEVIRTLLRKSTRKRLIGVAATMIITAVTFAVAFIRGSNHSGNPITLTHIGIMLCPLLIIAIYAVVAKVKNRRIHDGKYRIVYAYVSSKNTHTDDSSTTYELSFYTKNYGSLDHLVSQNAYLATVVNEDAYYLVVVPKRRRGKYKVVQIYSADRWRVAPHIPVENADGTAH